MSTPTELIKQYQNRIVQLTKEIDAKPFVYEVGMRFNPQSSFNYRKTREDEIEDLKRKINEERDREQLLSHNILNKQLQDQGIQVLTEKKTPLDNFIRFMNEGTPIGMIGNKLVAPVAQGVSNFVSGPSMIFLIIGAVVIAIIVLPMIFRK